MTCPMMSRATTSCVGWLFEAFDATFLVRHARTQLSGTAGAGQWPAQANYSANAHPVAVCCRGSSSFQTSLSSLCSHRVSTLRLLDTADAASIDARVSGARAVRVPAHSADARAST